MASAPAVECPRRPSQPLPKPGELVLRDFRSGETKEAAKQRNPKQPIKLVQWNIERGYKLKDVIEELKAIDGDVLSLQEIDIHCERSQWEDTGTEIAKALGLQYAFLCEFEELWSPIRDGDAQGGGVHGNAIMSKFDLYDLECVHHQYHPIDWEAPEHPLCKKEPRHGKRVTLAAKVKTPAGPLLMYSAHFEVFCGMLARMRQYADLVLHARNTSAAGGPKHQAILGDLNTQANSLARLSSNYCTDRMRWRSLGWFEAEVWDQYILKCIEDPAVPSKTNEWLASQGVDEATCKAILNPGFADPWHP
ncbi:hypothetical protein DUNSADRAFT_18793, partial [Dunaliella salina]